MKNLYILSIISSTSKMHLEKVLRFSSVQPSLYFTMFFLVILTSCTNENITIEQDTETFSTTELDMFSRVLDKNYIRNASLEEKLVYKDHYLTSLMETVIEVNPDFENIAGFKTSKKDNPEVYIEGLLRNTSQKTDNSASALKKGREFLNAFTDLEGETWYPVLKRLRKGDSDTKNAIYLLKSYNENSKEEFVKAYQLKKNGKFKLIHEDFTEEMFLNISKTGKADPSVYSVTLQGCAPGGDPMQKAAYNDCYSGGGGTIGGTGGSTNSYLIEKIFVKDKKESWLTPATISMEGLNFSIASNGSSTSSTLLTYWNNTPNAGVGTSGTEYTREIEVVKNKELNEWITVDYSPRAIKDFYAYVIFEYDGWPALRKSVNVRIDGKLLGTIKFRSYNDSYSKKIYTTKRSAVQGTDYSSVPSSNGVTVSNNTIAYKFY